MNGLIDFMQSHRRTVLTTMAVLFIAGVFSYITIPKEAKPDISAPFLLVFIVHPGISPEDSERLLIKPMEFEMRSLEGLKSMTSIANQGSAIMLLEFDVSFDVQEALAGVREKIDLAKPKLPSESEEPIVEETNTALEPVMLVALSGDVPERTLFRYANVLKDHIESMPSVLEAKLSGHRDELLEVVIDPARLASYGISHQELLTIVSLNNRLVPSGELDTGQGRFAVKVPGLFETRQDVLELPIKVSEGGVVTLGDVASIRRTFKDAEEYARYNSRPAIAIEIVKRIGSNIIETTEQTRALVDELSADWPETIRVDYMLDQSTWIRDTLTYLQAAILTAVLLVMIVVVAALGLRSALLVGIAIPTSFMAAFFVLASSGFTTNVMIMFGLVLSVGILVDASIVMVEYADRKMAEGLTRGDAYTLAARRMFWPIVSSTATTLAAFFPMLLWPGVSGKFMSYLPFTLIFVLGGSLVTALIFLPVLGSLAGGTEARNVKALKQLSGTEAGDVRTIPGFTGWYIRILDRLIYHPVRVIVIALAILGSIVFIFIQNNPGVQFFVDTDPEYLVGQVSARGNLSAQETSDIVRTVEEIIREVDGVLHVMSYAGPDRPTGGQRFAQQPLDSIGLLHIELQPYKERGSGFVIHEELRERVKNLPGINVEITQQKDGPPTGKDVQIELTSTDYEAMVDTASFIREHLDKNVAGLIDLEDTRPLPGVEWELDVDREKAGRFGTDVSSIGAFVQLVTTGALIGEYRPHDADEEVEIRARFPHEYRNIDQLDQLRITTPTGSVPISNFVTRWPTPKISSIERIDGLRRIEIKANTTLDPATGQKILADDKVGEISAWLEQQDINPLVQVRFRGANEEQADAQEFLGRAMLGVLFLMFVILLTQFNSFYHSILTLSTVVLSTVGVMAGMIITGQTFSVIMTGTGIVALAGIVVNNSIVLIDTYQRLLRDGLDQIEAALRTAGQRLRPILLTTITTVCGLMPMAVKMNINFFERDIVLGDPISYWWSQMATAIIFGLGFSTMLTLVLVPVLLAAPAVWRDRRTERMGKLPTETTPTPAE